MITLAHEVPRIARIAKEETGHPVKTEIIEAAQRGWQLFPVRPRGKKPLIKKWTERASANLDTLTRWESSYPDCNWGILTGAPSGIFVIDVDGEPGGETLAKLERQGFAIPPTLTVITGFGKHLYLRMPRDIDIRNDQSGRIGSHVDVRANGGFVVAAGSTHESGMVYQFIDSHAAIADAPKWLIEKLTECTKPSRKRKFGKGERTQALVSHAGWLIRRGASQEQTEAMLLDKNTREFSPLLPEEEVRSTSRDIFQRYPNRPNFTQDTQRYSRITREMSNPSMPSTDEQETLLKWPLKEYLKEIINFTTQVRELGDGHTPLFHFTRFCKAHPALTNLKNHEAMAQVEAVLYTFDELPIGCNPWKFYFSAASSADEAEIDFQYCWNQIRTLPFQDVVSDALRLATEKPIFHCTSRGDLYRRFVNLAAWLQILMKGQPIFLPCRKLAPLLRCSHTTICHLASLATEDGFLTVGQKEQFRSTGKAKAREYQFNLAVLKMEGDENESDQTISEICAREK